MTGPRRVQRWDPVIDTRASADHDAEMTSRETTGTGSTLVLTDHGDHRGLVDRRAASASLATSRLTADVVG